MLDDKDLLLLLLFLGPLPLLLLGFPFLALSIVFQLPLALLFAKVVCLTLAVFARRSARLTSFS